jgi:hypothetical protein
MKYMLWIALSILTTTLHAQSVKPRNLAKFNPSKVKDSISLKNGGKVYLYQDGSDKIMFMGQLLWANTELASGDLFKFGIGASADVFFKKYLSLHAEYTKDYFDLLKTLSRNDNQTNNNLSDVTGFSSAEAGVRVFLKDRKTSRKHKIILESHTHGRTTTNYYIAPKLPCRSVLALRAGFIRNNSIVTTDMASGGTVTAKDGKVLSTPYFTNAVSSGAYLGVADLVFFSAVTKNSFKNNSSVKI